MISPKLSIVVRAYNQEREVIRALQSILSQTLSFSVELIVGVDVSCDNTLAVVQAYCDNMPDNFTVKILSHASRMGGQKI